MADPICRWRNSSLKQLMEFNSILPFQPMPIAEAREHIINNWSLLGGDNFFTTPYQLAVQMALYYTDEDTLYPQLKGFITLPQGKDYMSHWGRTYYAPNPYTKSMVLSEKPVVISRFLVNWAIEKGSDAKFSDALKVMFKDPIGNTDILINMINNFGEVYINNGIVSLKDINQKRYSDEEVWPPFNPKDKKVFFDYIGLEITIDTNQRRIDRIDTEQVNLKYRQFITAIKSKPFLLLAGISGTGKSRIVRELARACWEPNSEEFKSQKPSNYEMVQVKPNWHDSSELIGYVSRIEGEKFIAGDFLKFIAKAWENQDIPYFLCLDEMNLAPVEQYFAEYLSVIETRKADGNGNVTTDPILKSNEQWFFDLTASLPCGEEVRQRFNNEGITIPKNLIVIGTVNMDETTFSFSRKVLDRAMTIEMNEVNLDGGLDSKYEVIGKLGKDNLIGLAVEGVDVYSSYNGVCDRVIDYLKKINKKLESTPFKVAFRTRNEFLLYIVNNLPYLKDADDKYITEDETIARALDEITSMKILSRIEGDESKVKKSLLEGLKKEIKAQLESIAKNDVFVARINEGETTEDGKTIRQSISLAKLDEMIGRLDSGYTSFWA